MVGPLVSPAGRFVQHFTEPSNQRGSQRNVRRTSGTVLDQKLKEPEKPEVGP